MWVEVEVQRPVSYGITLILPCPASLPSPTYKELKQHVSFVTEHLCSSFVVVAVCLTFIDIYRADPTDRTFVKQWINQMIRNKLQEITGIKIDVTSEPSFLCFVFVSN